MGKIIWILQFHHRLFNKIRLSVYIIDHKVPIYIYYYYFYSNDGLRGQFVEFRREYLQIQMFREKKKRPKEYPMNVQLNWV